MCCVDERYTRAQVLRGFKVWAHERQAVFLAPDPASRKAWVAAIKTIAAVRKRSSRKLRDVSRTILQKLQTEKNKGCAICKRKFGVLRQSKTCNSCHRFVCGSCSRATVLRWSFRRLETHRVCNMCQRGDFAIGGRKSTTGSSNAPNPNSATKTATAKAPKPKNTSETKQVDVEQKKKAPESGQNSTTSSKKQPVSPETKQPGPVQKLPKKSASFFDVAQLAFDQ